MTFLPSPIFSSLVTYSFPRLRVSRSTVRLKNGRALLNINSFSFVIVLLVCHHTPTTAKIAPRNPPQKPNQPSSEPLPNLSNIHQSIPKLIIIIINSTMLIINSTMLIPLSIILNFFTIFLLQKIELTRKLYSIFRRNSTSHPPLTTKLLKSYLLETFYCNRPDRIV